MAPCAGGDRAAGALGRSHGGGVRGEQLDRGRSPVFSTQHRNGTRLERSYLKRRESRRGRSTRKCGGVRENRRIRCGEFVRYSGWGCHRICQLESRTAVACGCGSGFFPKKSGNHMCGIPLAGYMFAANLAPSELTTDRERVWKLCMGRLSCGARAEWVLDARFEVRAYTCSAEYRSIILVEFMLIKK
jgi:hypothetical protein